MRDSESTNAAAADPDKAATAEQTCSARGCTSSATVALLWNNPKLHPPERRKRWLACDTHEASLEAFLAARNFMRDTQRL